MRRIDLLHLEHPFMGARMLRDQLNRAGYAVGRKHVGTLMKRMGIGALYRKPGTSKRGAGSVWMVAAPGGTMFSLNDYGNP